MTFRNDINGLRGIAVVAVVLFHFNSSWLPGGFAGVDVFFVISGYLMTKIIFRGIEQDNFSILRFYIARGNRIIPALSALCFLLIVFGWFYLTPLDYKALGKHVVSSVGFISNIIYWRESGYFDALSSEKWLLHTWSLSVEWQFYMLYPVALLIMKRFMSIDSIRAAILVGMVCGIVLSVYFTLTWPHLAYYSLLSRVWEILVGGVAFLFPFNPVKNRKNVLGNTGLTLIMLSFIFISKDELWPGYLAILPVLGTFLVIQAQRDSCFVTSNIIVQALGRWSYSIYLWHWPLVVATYYFSLNEQFLYWGVFFSIGLGFLSYRYIESIKFRATFTKPKQYFRCKPIWFVILVTFLGYLVFITRGFEWHYSEAVISSLNESMNKNPYNCMVDNMSPCVIGQSNNIKAIIVGDSHADALTTALASAFDLDEAGIIALTKASCPFILDMKSIDKRVNCLNENEKRLKYLQENYTNIPVYWVARSSVYIYGQSNPDRVGSKQDTMPQVYFSDTIYEKADESLLNEFESALYKTVLEVGKERHIFLVLPIPEMRMNVPKVLSKSLLLNGSSEAKVISLDKSIYIRRNKELIRIQNRIAKLKNVAVLDPTNFLCNMKTCFGELNGRPFYYDGDHLSEYGNKKLIPMFVNSIK